jgi:hypothetical protein
MQPAEDEPPPETRRGRGDTGKAFGRIARAILRRGQTSLAAAAKEIMLRVVRPDTYAAATAYLSDTLDWLNLWQANEIEDDGALDDDYDTQQNYSSPHL